MRFEFGPYHLDPDQQQLFRGNTEVPLTPKAFDTLLLLVRRAGHLVTKDELLETIWPDTHVQETGLTRNISSLRKALGERDSDEEYIVTVPKRGYRFVAAVRVFDPGPRVTERTEMAASSGPSHDVVGEPPRAAPTPRRFRVISIAALVLAALAGLLVVRDPRVATRLWRAEAVGSSPDRRSANPAAFSSYLNGRRAWNRRTPDSIEQARQFFTEALDHDPTYAAAYAGLADSYVLLGAFGSLRPEEAFPKAKAAAVRAIDLDEGLAEAHTSLAFARFAYEWDWPGAERAYKRAIELDSTYATAHHWYAILLIVLGRPDESIGMIRRAEQIDPLSEPIASDVGEILFMARRYDESIEHLQRVLRVSPAFTWVHSGLGNAYLEKGRFDQAIAEYGRASLSPDGAWQLAHAYARSGETAKARRFITAPDHSAARDRTSSYGRAVVQVSLGDHDGAIASLEQAFERRLIAMTWLAVSPSFDPIRSDPRFKDLLRRLHLG